MNIGYMEKINSVPVQSLSDSANGTIIDTYRAGDPAYETAIGIVEVGAFGGTTTEAKSTLSTTLAGDNNDLVFTSKLHGEAGDDITITYVDPGETGELGVVVTGTDIVVNLGYAESAITTTGALLKAAIEATPAAHALVGVAHKAANDGSGLVTALTETPLAGGRDLFVPTVLFQESDSSTFASGNTTMKGGAAVAIAAAHSYLFNLERRKRYVRAVVTFAGGSSPTAIVYAGLILSNIPLPSTQLLTAASVDNS